MSGETKIQRKVRELSIKARDLANSRDYWMTRALKAEMGQAKVAVEQSSSVGAPVRAAQELHKRLQGLNP